MMDMRGGKPGCARCRSISMLTGLIIFWAFSEFGKFRSMLFTVCWDTLIRRYRSLPKSCRDTDSVLMLRGKRFLIFGKIFWTRFSVHIPEK